MLPIGINLSRRSLDNLYTCHPLLVELVKISASSIPKELDFTIVHGHRSVKEQQRLFQQGFTKIDGVNRLGKHNYNPSQAFDFYPWTKKYGLLTGNPAQVKQIADRVRFNTEGIASAKARVDKFIGMKFYGIAMHFKMVAAQEGINIRWGGDWNSDGDILDHSFLDFPHIELLL